MEFLNNFYKASPRVQAFMNIGTVLPFGRDGETLPEVRKGIMSISKRFVESGIEIKQIGSLFELLMDLSEDKALSHDIDGKELGRLLNERGHLNFLKSLNVEGKSPEDIFMISTGTDKQCLHVQLNSFVPGVDKNGGKLLSQHVYEIGENSRFPTLRLVSDFFYFGGCVIEMRQVEDVEIEMAAAMGVKMTPKYEQIVYFSDDVPLDYRERDQLPSTITRMVGTKEVVYKRSQEKLSTGETATVFVPLGGGDNRITTEIIGEDRREIIYISVEDLGLENRKAYNAVREAYSRHTFALGSPQSLGHETNGKAWIEELLSTLGVEQSKESSGSLLRSVHRTKIISGSFNLGEIVKQLRAEDSLDYESGILLVGGRTMLNYKGPGTGYRQVALSRDYSSGVGLGVTYKAEVYSGDAVKYNGGSKISVKLGEGLTMYISIENVQVGDFERIPMIANVVIKPNAQNN